MTTYIVATDNKEFVKIGKTDNSIESRVNSYRTGNPYHLHIVGYFPEDIEAQLHDLFSQHRRNGEWFSYCVLEEIRKIPAFTPYVPQEKHKKAVVKKVIVTVSLDTEIDRKIEMLAEREQRSFSSMCSILIEKGLNLAKTDQP